MQNKIELFRVFLILGSLNLKASDCQAERSLIDKNSLNVPIFVNWVAQRTETDADRVREITSSPIYVAESQQEAQSSVSARPVRSFVQVRTQRVLSTSNPVAQQQEIQSCMSTMGLVVDSASIQTQGVEKLVIQVCLYFLQKYVINGINHCKEWQDCYGNSCTTVFKTTDNGVRKEKSEIMAFKGDSGPYKHGTTITFPYVGEYLDGSKGSSFVIYQLDNKESDEYQVLNTSRK